MLFPIVDSDLSVSVRQLNSELKSGSRPPRNFWHNRPKLVVNMHHPERGNQLVYRNPAVWGCPSASVSWIQSPNLRSRPPRNRRHNRPKLVVSMHHPKRFWGLDSDKFCPPPFWYQDCSFFGSWTSTSSYNIAMIFFYGCGRSFFCQPPEFRLWLVLHPANSLINVLNR